MPQDVKIWRISKEDTLKEIPKSSLNLEERIENWVEKDISIISNDLLVIGRQIETDFSGIIDILCIDEIGDLVIIELKRDKTPRETVAQILDYATWVAELSNEKITDLAQRYLTEDNSLDEAFNRKFGHELPDLLNAEHRMLIVAGEIDSSSERIIKYLSEYYGVGINGVTFRFFREDESGSEFLSRVSLVDTSEVERAQKKYASKRRPPLSIEEIFEIAENNGVRKEFETLFEGLKPPIFDYNQTTRSSIAFIGKMGEKESRNTIFSLRPSESNTDVGVKYDVFLDRFIEYFGMDREIAKDLFPNYSMKAVYDEWAGEIGHGYFESIEQISKFISDLKKIKG